MNKLQEHSEQKSTKDGVYLKRSRCGSYWQTRITSECGPIISTFVDAGWIKVWSRCHVMSCHWLASWRRIIWLVSVVCSWRPVPYQKICGPP